MSFFERKRARPHKTNIEMFLCFLGGIFIIFKAFKEERGQDVLKGSVVI